MLEGGLRRHPGLLSGKEAKLEADGFESAEVGIESGKGKTGADRESGEVGIHPDLG